MDTIEIIPAILVDDFEELQEKIGLVASKAKRIQIDVCDGRLTPNASWPYRKPDHNFEMLVREEISLPAWETVDYEFDLMVDHPESVVDDWVSAGASRIVLHIESKGNIKQAVEKLLGRTEIGVALNIETPVNMINDTMINDQIQFIQLMGIDRIGFQGQTFDAKVIDKIKEVKAAFPDLDISIDGGVSLENAASLIATGADRLIVGSAILNAESPLSALEEFQNLK